MVRWVSCVVVSGAVACAGGPASGGGDSGSEGSGSGSESADGSSRTATTQLPGDGSTDAGEDASDDPAATGDGDPGETSGDDTTGGSEVVCPAGALEPGMHTGLTLEHDGESRAYDVYVPAGYTNAEAVPLVFDFHGYLGSSGGQATFSQIVPAADAAGVVVVLPQGISSSWNAGACCGTAASEGVDDVGFIRALVDHVGSLVCFDPARVFAMGMSNGGYMSNRLGCETADVFAAIGPVAGMIQIPFDDCQPTRPMPVMEFHGTSDLIVPYEGGGLTGFPSVEDSIAVWVDRNGCRDPGPTVTYAEGDVTCETWSACDEGAEVTLCTVEGMGHCWPGNLDCPFGASTDDISATHELLGFFAAHPMP